MQSYLDRSSNFTNPTAIRLLQLMDRKRTNLCVAVDCTTKAELLAITRQIGPFICLLKTHIDIILDFDQDLIEQLLLLSKHFDFMIFEDRKFADIGNTVKLQYSGGIYKISSWADITNAHAVPGDGIISGLASVGHGRGLLLLAEMSSKGTLATGNYAVAATQMAEQHSDFVIGFIAQKRRLEVDGRQIRDFLYLTPGVSLDATQDSLGQLYSTPHQVICERQCDVIIVGRGIYADPHNIIANAQRYRDAGWTAYESRKY